MKAQKLTPPSPKPRPERRPSLCPTAERKDGWRMPTFREIAVYLNAKYATDEYDEARVKSIYQHAMVKVRRAYAQMIAEQEGAPADEP